MYMISACLCGVNCKYNGKNNYNEYCFDLLIKGKALIVCPEQLGGLTTPRVPSEIQGCAEKVLKGITKIVTKDGIDVTENFIRGGDEVVKLAKILNIKKAIFKEGSPSCGVNFVYDGTFSDKKIKGMGITTLKLKQLSIDVISEKDLGGKENGHF